MERLETQDQYMQKSAFVMMPFGEWQDVVYQEVYKPAFEKCKYVVSRADDFFKPNEIIATIWENIKSADIILADLTGRNPNVYYELGLAHAIGKAVILVTSVKDEIPFDLQHLRHLRYNKEHPTWGEKLRNDIIDALNSNNILYSVPMIFKKPLDSEKYIHKSSINSGSIPSLVLDAIKDKPMLKSLKIKAHSTTVIYNAFENYLKTHRVETCELILRKFSSEILDENPNDERIEQTIILRNIENWRSQELIGKSMFWECEDSLTEYQIIIDDEILITGIYIPDSRQPSKLSYRNMLYVLRKDDAGVLDSFITRFNKQKEGLKLYEKPQ